MSEFEIKLECLKIAERLVGQTADSALVIKVASALSKWLLSAGA